MFTQNMQRTLNDKKKINNPIKIWAKDSSRPLTTRSVQMANKHLKRFSTSFVRVELQIKTVMRYIYTPIRTGKILKTDNIKCWKGYRGKEAHLYC